MRKGIKPGRPAAGLCLERLPRRPERVVISLDERVNRCRVDPVVHAGQEVAAGETIAVSGALHIHSSIDGRVTGLSGGEVTIRGTGSSRSRKRPTDYRNSDLPRKDFPRFAASIGLAGMGGGMFPASIKLSASRGASTLVINGVECEPGVSIDERLLLENAELVKAGAGAAAAAIGAGRVVIALKETAKALSGRLKTLYPYDIIFMPPAYPGGSERLLLRKLAGVLPSPGILPSRFGYLIHNTASVWSIGKAVVTGTPVIERPLTLAIHEVLRKNVIVPVGMRAGELLGMYGHHYDGGRELIIAGGLMMGMAVGDDFGVRKGTNSIFLIRKKDTEKEGACILCGSCFDACPLGLHPAFMAEKVRKKAPVDAELRAQLDECFLCGVCAAVCPSHMQLIKYLTDGKKSIKGAV